ncbi:MAG: FlgD immunoglobulin-like domain containing protein [candidate division WOR-3 bacterium]|nr:FlgD immunoglobulin-like domain containing protein [candidate division WOR-3 bacterium]
MPPVASVGDTIDAWVAVGDAYGVIDSTYNGYADLDARTNSLDLINADSSVYDDCVPIQSGLGEFRLHYPYAGTTYTNMQDEESSMLYSYFSSNGFEGVNKLTVWHYSTMTAANALQLFLPENNSITIWENEVISVAAMYNDSIAGSYNGYVDISVTGSAAVNEDSIYLENGTGEFFISDSIAEDVIITASDGVMNDIDTLHVLDDSKAALIAVAASSEMLVNGDNDITFFAMTSSFENDTSYSGIIHLIIDDTHGDTLSFNCPEGYTIPISGGLVTQTFTNSEPEKIRMAGYSVSGLDTIYLEDIEVLSQYQIYPQPDAVFNPAGDTLFVEIIDADSSVVNYSTQLDQLYAEEENPNSSFTIHSSYNPFPVSNGTAELSVSDPESEIVELYTEYYDTLLADYDTYKLLYTLDPASGIKPMTGISIDDYYLSKPNPSPASGDVSIKFGMPVRDNVRINIYDQSGRLINNLMDREISGGHYMIKWSGNDSNGSEVPAGTYFIIIRFGDSALRNEKIIRIK